MRPLPAAAAIVLLLPFLRAGALASQGAPAQSSALSPLAAKYAKKHEALARRFAAKRKAMVDEPAWKALSPEKQKAKLDALDAGFKARDARISADEAAERKLKGNVEQTKAQQQKAEQLEQVKTQAEQDMRDRKK